MFHVVRIGFGTSYRNVVQRPVNHRRVTRLSVQFKVDRAATLCVATVNRQEFDDQRFTLFDDDREFLFGLKPKEK